MPLRIWQKLSKLLDFPRLVLIELEGIRRTQARLEEAQARLEEAQARLKEAQTRLEAAQARLEEKIEKWTLSAVGRLDNFFRISLQNEEASGGLVANMKRQIDHLEASLQELRENNLSKQTNNTNLDKG